MTKAPADTWLRRAFGPSLLRRLLLAQILLLVLLGAVTSTMLKIELRPVALRIQGPAASAQASLPAPPPLAAHGPRADVPESLTLLRNVQRLASRGFIILPLTLSLPLLVLSACLSVWFALRPWRKVSDEVAARGPQDLRPLSFLPAHRELRPLVEGINALLGRVRDSAEREQRFIADAAHELRTPLAAMRVHVEALQGHAADGAQRELLEGTLHCVDRATRVVNQMLALMRSDAQAAQAGFGPVALERLAQERLAVLSVLAGERRVDVELDGDRDVCVWGHCEALGVMVDNLVGNAIKYSPPDAVVTVRVRRLSATALLDVVDRGPGIAPAMQERVFDRFFRAPDQMQQGSGLGLAIVKSTVALHGGRIALARSTIEGGLTVSVELPLCESLHQ